MPQAPPRRKTGASAPRTASIPRSSSPKSSKKSGAKKTSKSPSPRARRVLIFLGAVLGVFLIVTGTIVGALDGYGWVDRTRKADAIVILGAHVRSDGQPGLGLKMRTNHALQLYKKGYAKKIICTGGRGTYPPPEAEAAARVLRQRGVPPSDILLENQSTSTWENAAYASEICRAKGYKNVIIVSDPFHLWRAEHNFARCGIRGYGSPVAREMWKEQQARKIFWTTREALLVMRDWVLRRV